MRKKKLIKEMFKEFERRYEPVVQLINKCDMQQIMLLQKVERVLDPFNHFVKKIDFEQETERLREYTEEVEHKVSHEFYNNVGLKKALRFEFADLINQNRTDINKILDSLGSVHHEH